MAIFFFFQAEDGIRDYKVTGVQTCALPIFCAELLRTHGGRVGLRSDFSLVDGAEGYFLLRGLARELPLRYYQHLQFPTFYFPDILQAISRAKDELVTPGQYQWLAQQMLEW